MHCRLYIECWDHHRDVTEPTETTERAPREGEEEEPSRYMPDKYMGRGAAISSVSRVFSTAREADQVAQQIKAANRAAGIYCAVIRRSLHNPQRPHSRSKAV